MAAMSVDDKAIVMVHESTQMSQDASSRATSSMTAKTTPTVNSQVPDSESRIESVSVTTEQELGIFDDNADCDDLSDSELDVGTKGASSRQSQMTSQGQPGSQSMKSSQRASSPQIDVSISRKQKTVCVSDVIADDATTADPNAVPEVYMTNASDIYNVSLIRGKNTTPASLFTDFSELHSPRARRSHPLPQEAREAVYRRAINLMSERCTSQSANKDRSWQTPLVANTNPPFGEYLTNYFFVHQKKPVPMPPLKAWRGYHGNVYFEPIQVFSAKSRSGIELESGPVTAASINRALASGFGQDVEPMSTEVPEAFPVGGLAQNVAAPTRKSRDNQRRGDSSRSTGVKSRTQEWTLSPSAIEDSSPKANHDSESRTRSRVSKASGSASNSKFSRPMAILDKRAVFEQFNENLHEDMTWIKGQESTGSLCISPGGEERSPERQRKFSPERLCRGSMAHKVHTERQKRQHTFALSGDKVAEVSCPQKTKRTPQNMQTQYTQSSTRKPKNTSDVYYEKQLPPLDQLRATLQQFNNSGTLPVINAKNTPAISGIRQSTEDKYLPYVKYGIGHGPRANVRLTQSVK